MGWTISKRLVLLLAIFATGLTALFLNTRFSSGTASNTGDFAIYLITLLVVITTGYFINRSINKALKLLIDGLASASSEIEGAAGQVAASSEHLASGTSEQASSVEETSASLEETETMTKQNADNANHANSLMNEMAAVVGSADAAMQELTNSMNEALTASEETSKIIKTIDDIAFQTNLLALNAAVEAARAGEAGAGFAVVADEVRNLAQRAAEAAKNTATLLEDTTTKIRTGSDMLGNATEAFSRVAENAGKAKELIDEISVASQEQAQGIGQINTAINEIDKVTQKNAATSEQAASAASELSSQASMMLTFVDDLARLIGQGGSSSARPSRSIAPREKKSVSIASGQQRASSTVKKKPLALPAKAATASNENETGNTNSKAEEIIPFSDNEFEDF